MPPLTAAQRKHLRARAHSLKPVILVGDAGVSDGIVTETDKALEHHELIKVRLPGVAKEERARMAKTLCDALGAQQVQTIGRVQVLFRARPDEPGRVPAKRPAAKSGKPRQR